MKRRGGFGLLLVTSLLAGLLVVPGAAAQGPDTQVAMVLDGSGSIQPDEWTLITDGLAAAVRDGSCIPQNGSVELTVIQFSDYARLEVGPVVIDSANAGAVATQIEGIPQIGSTTCVACGLCLAQDVLLNHPDASYDAGAKQAINVVTDGLPNECAADDCADCTGEPDWVCPITASCTDPQASAETARAYAISQLGMDVDPQDEIDAEFIGSPDGPSEWLRTEIVWPEQLDGDGYYAPPFDQGGGWVRVVADADEFAETICEKFQVIVDEEPVVGGTTYASDLWDVVAPWMIATLAGFVLLGGLAAARLLTFRRDQA